jgi:hypothetical protein
MPDLDAADNERRRAQIARVKEAGFAAVSGRTVAQRTADRDALADRWADWLHREMTIRNVDDPVALLPDALARLQQAAEDQTAAAIRRLKTDLRKALTK